jgi:SynChlorMet cassette protein ScmD
VQNGKKPIVSPYVVLREEFDDWAVLFNTDTGHGYGLSPTGVYVWKCLDGEHSIDDMLEALRRDATDVPQEAGEQIIAFVEALTRHGLAGYEGEEGYDEKGRLPPIPTCAETVQFAYEPPKLVNLSGEQAALGTAASDACSSGVVTSGGCCHSGTSAGLGPWQGDCCWYGDCADNNWQHGCCETGPCPDSGSLNCMGGGCPSGDCEGGSHATTDCVGGGNRY